MARKFKIGMICEAGFFTGTYYYTVNVAEQLQALGHDVTMITPFNIKELKVKQKVYNSLLFKVPVVGRAVWLMSLYFRLHKSDFEVIESSWYGMMNLLPVDLYKDKLKVTTLFDVMADDKRFWKAHPDFFVVAKILQPPHLRFNDIVMTSSYYSKEQIMKVKRIPGEKVWVAYYGVSDEFGKRIDRKSLAKTKKKLNLPEKFILNVGRIKMTKNIIGIVKAFNMIAKRNPDIHLVFTGSLDTTIKATEYHKLVHQEIQKMDGVVAKRIIFLNYVSEDDVKALYALATVFLMPSFEEGFGLPVIEAMRSGVPVVTSNISCMPEVAGGAALLCDPDDYKDIASKVEMILKDNDFAQKLVSKGNVRAKYFTWEKTAKESVKIYERAWKKKFGKLRGF